MKCQEKNFIDSLLFSLFSVPHRAFAGPTGHETSAMPEGGTLAAP
jgi:hypothetical protein